jgi:hypothetical protein
MPWGILKIRALMIKYDLKISVVPDLPYRR